jgi:hypothetical protein
VDSESNKVPSKWDLLKHGFPQGSILGPLVFLIYINDITLSISKLVTPVHFSDDTSIVISNSRPEKFKRIFSELLTKTSKWFQSDYFSLNCDKTHFLQFSTKKPIDLQIQITTPNAVISNINSTKFWLLIIDCELY